jgi:agmatinase
MLTPSSALCENAADSHETETTQEPMRPILSPNKLAKDGAKTLAVQYEQSDDYKPKFILQGLDGEKVLWSKSIPDPDYRTFPQNIDAEAICTSQIKITKYVRYTPIFNLCLWNGGVHWPFDYDLLQRHKLIDYGDIPFHPGQVDQMLANTEKHVGLMSAAGVGTLGLGGDHLVAYPAIKAHAKHHGKLSLIHFDAHTDTHEAAHLNHGSMFWYGVKEGLIDPDTSIQIGIRTLIPPDDRFTVLTSHQCLDMGSKAIVEKVRQIVGDRKCYISLDVDGMDPAFAPGTGTPLPGGITSAMQREILWGTHGLNIVGGDVVEVSPPYDPSQITAILGASIGMDIIYAMAAAPFRNLSSKS